MVLNLWSVHLLQLDGVEADWMLWVVYRGLANSRIETELFPLHPLQKTIKY